MSFRLLNLLLLALAAGCADDPAMRPQPQPPLDPCPMEQPCTAGRCPGARKITVGVQRCALLCDKTVRCSEPGDLFTPTAETAPLEVVVSGALDLVSGGQHSCALLEDRTVTCWGNNRRGALGRERDDSDHWYAPASMPGLRDVVALSSRNAFYDLDWTCALQQDGGVACWGHNLVGVTPIPELQGARAIRVGDGEAYGIMGDRRVLMYSFGIGVTAFELARPVRDLEAGWHAFCAGDGDALECVDLIRSDALVGMQLPGPYRKLAHSWAKPLVIDEQGRVHFNEAQKPDTWISVPVLDGAFDLGTNYPHEACGLFPDGRITCAERL